MRPQGRGGGRRCADGGEPSGGTGGILSGEDTSARTEGRMCTGISLNVLYYYVGIADYVK